MVEVQDAAGEPVVGIEVAFRVIGSGTLSATNARTNSNGQAQSFLILSFEGRHQVEVNVAGVQPVIFNAIGSGPQVLINPSELPPMYWISDGDSSGVAHVRGLSMTTWKLLGGLQRA